MEKPKSLLIMFLAIALVVAGLIYYSFSKIGENLMNSDSETRQQEEQTTDFKGPTGEPYIEGPGGPPPTSE